MWPHKDDPSRLNHESDMKVILLSPCPGFKDFDGSVVLINLLSLMLTGLTVAI
jgi:hypothetical protein